MEKRYAQFEDCRRLERFTGADYDPERNLLVWTSGRSGLQIKDLTNGTVRRIETGGRGEGSPSFRPGGKEILFAASLPDRGRQLCLYDPEEDRVRVLTSFSGPEIDPVWSPDGTKILFASPVGPGTEEAASAGDGSDAIVIEDFNYKFDGAGYVTPDSHMHLFVADASDGSVIRLTDGEYDYMHHNWCADSCHVVCESTRFNGREQALAMDILMIDTCEDPEIRRLSEGRMAVSYPNPVRPAATPDGRWVISGFLTENGFEEGAYPNVFLYRVGTDGSGLQLIFEPDEDCYQCVQFPYNAGCGWGLDKLQISEDGSEVFFHAGWNGQCRLYRLPLTGGKEHAQLVLGGRRVVHGMTRIRGGKALVCLSEPDRPEYYCILVTASGELSEPVLQSAEDLLAEAEYAVPEELTVKTLDGLSSVHGWVLPPAGRKPEEKYPAILYIHGGPHPFYTYGFTPELQAFAAQGFAVLYCNPRGTSSYGDAHLRLAKANDARRQSDVIHYYDLLQFTDAVCREFDFIDPDRIGVTGGSYGGFMANYMMTHCDRFRAYVSQRSISNDQIMYASSDMQGESRGYARYEDFLLDNIRRSAVSYAERVTAPVLFLHGEDDFRTPVEGAHQFYTAIKDLHPDLPCRLVIYPHLNHDQPGHPKQQEHYYREMTEWFRKYL